MPKAALTPAPAPIVKKWCSQTKNKTMQMNIVAATIERYPNSGFDENVEKDLGEDAEGGKHENVDLGMAPGPDQVDEHHLISAGFVGEEMEAEIAVQRQHRQRGGEDREGCHDEQVGRERGPTEHRHSQVAHTRRTHLEDGRHQVDAGKQRADAGDLDRPKIVIDPDARRVGGLRQGGIGQPAGARELTDDKRDVDQQGSGSRQPEADGVERRKRTFDGGV